jgi:hypothetical protein
LLVWGLAETGLFAKGMIENCSGGILIYGALLVLLHIALFVVYLFSRKGTLPYYFDL